MPEKLRSNRQFNRRARSVASDGFIREIEEELQRDRMALLWKRFGPIIIGAALLVVIATAGKVGWDAWQARQLTRQGEAFAAAQAALDRGDPGVAATLFAELADGQGGGVAAVARLREAEARFLAGDEAAGLALLDRLAGASGIDPLLGDFAAIAAAQRRLGQTDPAELRAALQPRMAANAPFRHSAREIAALAALEAGDREGAIEILRQLESDAATPEALRRRAVELLASLGAAAAQPAADEAS